MEKDKKPNLITIQQAAFESLLDRVNQTAVTNFENKVQELELKLSNQSDHVKKIDNFLWIIVAVLLIGFATLLAQVGGMVIETWRFNSYVYKDSQQLKKQEELLQSYIDQNRLIMDSLDKIDNSVKK